MSRSSCSRRRQGAGEGTRAGTARQGMFDIIQAFTGQGNVLAVPRPLAQYIGCLEGGVFLSQIIYWSDRNDQRSRAKGPAHPGLAAPEVLFSKPLWQVTKTELALQMARATYCNLLQEAQFGGVEGREDSKAGASSFGADGKDYWLCHGNASYSGQRLSRSDLSAGTRKGDDTARHFFLPGTRDGNL